MRVSATQAFGSRALDTALSRSQLPERDRALVTELVYGTLRCTAQLDDKLSRYLTQPLHKLPPPVRMALRLGVYQILHTRIAAHSAVNESVALVQRFGHLRGVVNAVLRKIAQAHADDSAKAGPSAKELEPTAPTAQFADNIAELSIEGSHPTWLVRQLTQQLGFEQARAWVLANNQAAPLAIRVNGLQKSCREVQAALEEHGVEVTAHPHVPMALVGRRGGRVVNMPGFEQGDFTVQDPAAMLVGLWAAPSAGQLVLDTCAAPGGKSLHLAELMANTGLVVAMDVHPGKKRLIDKAAARLNLTNIRTAVGDARSATDLAQALQQATGRPGAKAELVVVDAPCSGMGTLRRNPELRTCQSTRIEALALLQRDILQAAATQVAEGGHLVYAVCTMTQQEGPDQVDAFLARHPEFEVAPLPQALEAFAAGPYLTTWTHRHAMDSFFAAKLRRKTS